MHMLKEPLDQTDTHEQGRGGGLRFPEIPDIKSVLVGELANRGDWIVAKIQTGYL